MNSGIVMYVVTNVDVSHCPSRKTVYPANRSTISRKVNPNHEA